MKRYLRFIAAYASGAFVLAALLPIWSVWYVGEWEANGEMGSFPSMVASLIRVAGRVRNSTLCEFYWQEPVKLMIVLIGGAAVGFFKARRLARPS